MKKEYIKINRIPSILWGEPSSHVYLYIHGQGGNKEEAEFFSRIVSKHNYQVLSIDLPEHGERKGESVSFLPWEAVPELKEILCGIKDRWENISLFANSIGAYFSLLAFPGEPFKKALFVSPILDMKQLISKMMSWADVSESQLEKERTISTSFGHTLTWEYWKYALEHPATSWDIPTRILCGAKDNLADLSTIEQFTLKHSCDLTISENAGHWFHIKEELGELEKWVNESLSFKRTDLPC